MSHLKLRALLDNCSVMRKFEWFRSDFAPSTWIIRRSSTNQVSTPEDWHTEKHLTSAPLAQLAAFRSHRTVREKRGRHTGARFTRGRGMPSEQPRLSISANKGPKPVERAARWWPSAPPWLMNI